MSERRADVLIIGAGPAGLAAAKGVAEQGRQALLVDNNPQVGGQIWRDGPNAQLPAEARQLRAALSDNNVSILTGARVVRAAGDHALLLETAGDHVFVSYEALILCTGARERLLPFPGWTLPGVTGAGGLQALLKGGYEVSGDRVVVAGSGPLLLASAHAADQAGADLAAIAEQASLGALARFAGILWRWPSKARQSVALASSRYRWGSYVTEALGDRRLEAVRLRRANGKEQVIRCDRLACGYGLVPNEELGVLLGCEIEHGAIRIDERQATTRAGVFAAGECTGIGGSELAQTEGRIAGLQAVAANVDAATWSARRRWQGFADALARTFVLNDALRQLARPGTIICRCEDVPRRALDGEAGWTTAKLENRCGMGACQGRVCGPATEFLYDWQRSSVRPPVYPARVETLAEYHATEDEPSGQHGI